MGLVDIDKQNGILLFSKYESLWYSKVTCTDLFLIFHAFIQTRCIGSLVSVI